MERYFLKSCIYSLLIGCAVLQMSCAAMLFPRTVKIRDAGVVNVISTPPGATILHNGTVVGKTPMKVSVATKPVLSSNKQANVLNLMKEGYQPQTITLTPKNETISHKRLGVWIGLLEVAAGIAMKSGAVILIGGFETGVGLTKYGKSTVVTRHYDQDISVELESVEVEQKRQEALKKAAMEQKIQEELAWRAGAVERSEQERKRQQAEAENRQREQANAVRMFANLQEGDMICAREAKCYSKNADDCLRVAAFIEKWNSDRSKYQIRVHTVNSGGITYTDASGAYTYVDDVRYHKGEIIWINPFERPNTIWVTCKNK